MTETELEKILTEGALELGARVGEREKGLFMAYLKELGAWNRKINLTAIEDDRGVVIRHFLDSLTPLRFVRGSRRLLDIGSGGGFPGIPLKIAMPELEVVLMDSVAKKVHFMRHIIRTLGLSGAEAIAGRVEDRAMLDRYSGAFDCVISRAFAELGEYLRLALPYAAPGGLLVAMKGPAVLDELKGAPQAGLSAPEVHEVAVPHSDRSTFIVVCRKEM